MPRVHVYDPPMCCSAGVCGPVVDPVLPRFAGDLAWLAANGVEVARFNLAQEPEAFVQSAAVLEALKGPGPGALPVVLVDGAIASQGRYPSRDELAAWSGLAYTAANAADTTLPALSLPAAACCGPDDGSEGSGCCG